MVHRSLYEEYVERVRSYRATPVFEKATTRREVWVEPLFAEAKQLAAPPWRSVPLALR